MLPLPKGALASGSRRELAFAQLTLSAKAVELDTIRAGLGDLVRRLATGVSVGAVGRSACGSRVPNLYFLFVC